LGTIEPTHGRADSIIQQHADVCPPDADGVGMSGESRHRLAGKLVKTIPGLLISAFFLWKTFFPRGHPAISHEQLHGLRLVQPAWFVGVLVFSVASYTMRSLRWKRMMRPAGTSFKTCARVLMTSLATILGMIPMALALEAGSEQYAPLARAIIGGLTVSVIVTVFVVPAAYLLVHRKEETPRHRGEAATGTSEVAHA